MKVEIRIGEIVRQQEYSLLFVLARNWLRYTVGGFNSQYGSGQFVSVSEVFERVWGFATPKMAPLVSSPKYGVPSRRGDKTVEGWMVIRANTMASWVSWYGEHCQFPSTGAWTKLAPRSGKFKAISSDRKAKAKR
uniref:Uncharacterized protein n=1 Tax=Vespula pensylvanica TaxID=30213 RepID=A0A834JT87_VESPE|nr:hypothetical protein H0235_016938 [Vespula pensylvanica]